MKFFGLTPAERQQWQSNIVALEHTARYPLGSDFFQIDHGVDYFAFFDRLGSVDYYVGIENQQVIAVGAAILRQVPAQPAGNLQPTWYLCDLKVHPEFQGRRASVRLLRYGIMRGMQRCDRGYLISMNPGDGTPNRLVQMLLRWPVVPLQLAGILQIYSLDATQMRELEPLLRQHRGAIGYRSLLGVKDLRLQSSGAVLPLLHMQWGEALVGAELVPRPGYQHMFCVESQDPLALALAKIGMLPQASATVVAHRMEGWDWRFVLTSDI
jgi:hypothetical protein